MNHMKVVNQNKRQIAFTDYVWIYWIYEKMGNQIISHSTKLEATVNHVNQIQCNTGQSEKKLHLLPVAFLVRHLEHVEYSPHCFHISGRKRFIRKRIQAKNKLNWQNFCSNTITLISKSWRVGSAYMATVAPLRTSQGWCLASVSV